MLFLSLFVKQVIQCFLGVFKAMKRKLLKLFMGVYNGLKHKLGVTDTLDELSNDRFYK